MSEHLPRHTKFGADRLRAKPARPRVWSHQDELRSALGKEIKLSLTNGNYSQGTLLAADAYTIKIAKPKFASSRKPEDNSNLIYFKHSVLAYEVL